MPAMSLRPISALVGALITAMVVAPSAWAHTEVQRSTPSPGAEVEGLVDRVELVFLDPIQPEVNIEVAGPDGEPVAGLEPAHLGEDRRGASARFEPLVDPGTYEVAYDFVALDGAAQRGSYTFRHVGGSPNPVLDDPSDAGGAGVIGVVAFVVLAVAAGVAARLRGSR